MEWSIINPKQAQLPNRTEADLITEFDQAVRNVHSCNSWFHIEIAM